MPPDSRANTPFGRAVFHTTRLPIKNYAGRVTEEQSILVRVSGKDRPGITADLLGLLSGAGAAVGDIEQVVVRGHLTLCVLVTVPAGRDLIKELLLFGWERQIEIDFEVVLGPPVPTGALSVVTLLGNELSPQVLAEATSAIAASGANIDRIVRLSKYPIWTYEFLIEGGDYRQLQEALVDLASSRPIDVALQPGGLSRRAARLVVLDMDSTLIQNEVIDLLADEAGCGPEVEKITSQAMAGELDFSDSLRRRVALLAGQPVSIIDRAMERLELTPGTRTFTRTLRRLGYRVAVISGGFSQFTDYLAAELDLDHAHSNHLEIKDGVLTGELLGPIVDRRRKADLLIQIAEAEDVPLAQVVAVGDGANDLDMLSVAGLGIAFNAKPAVSDAADTSLRVPYLDAILFLLGVSREEIEAADAM
ncbi:MAG: phosphoserine phosphatase [Candidatus Poriferisodalaceae bacterium]